MTKEELIRLIRHSAGLETNNEAARAYEAILEAMTEELSAGNVVSLRGFGTFKVKEAQARRGRNPNTGESMIIPAHKAVRFTTGKELRRKVSEAEEDGGRDWLDFKTFLGAVDSQMRDMKRKFDAYGSGASKAGEGAREYYAAKRQGFHERYEELRARLRDLASTSGGAWREMRTGLEAALDDLREAFKRAAGKF